MSGKIKVWMVGLALLAMAGLAVAAGPGDSVGDKANCPFGIDRIKLTPEQKTKLGELREKFWKDTVSLRSDLRIKRLELRILWAAPNPDKEKILAKQKERNALRDKMQAKVTDLRLEIRKVLTPEQVDQIGRFMSVMRFNRGMGRHGLWRQGPCSGPGQGPGQGPGHDGPR
ncbi:MAG: Spy/CpxP family protein refolding chaperone [Thermodesulfobacteriota bacterium]|jgi:Spy/CpxP family protein refolding chaperone